MALPVLGREFPNLAFLKVRLSQGWSIKRPRVVPVLQGQMAPLLLGHCHKARAEAMRHQDFAKGELRELKMQPSLESGLEHRKN